MQEIHVQKVGGVFFCKSMFSMFFRFFDILKMGPVKYADTKIKNAYGVMLDDVFAGIFASILLLGVLFFIVNR